MNKLWVIRFQPNRLQTSYNRGLWNVQFCWGFSGGPFGTVTKCFGNKGLMILCANCFESTSFWGIKNWAIDIKFVTNAVNGLSLWGLSTKCFTPFFPNRFSILRLNTLLTPIFLHQYLNYLPLWVIRKEKISNLNKFSYKI